VSTVWFCPDFDPTDLAVTEATDGVYSHRTDEGDIVLQDASKPDYEEVLLNATDVREVRW
jgi:hypothetical protein